MNVPVKKKHRFKVGDRVRFRLGTHVASGPVVEDFGNIGVGGEQLVRVEVSMDATTKLVFEVGADSLTLAGRRRAAA
jgi:hypothetical protein